MYHDEECRTTDGDIFSSWIKSSWSYFLECGATMETVCTGTEVVTIHSCDFYGLLYCREGCRTCNHTYRQSREARWLTCVSWHGGRKPKSPQRTHTDTRRAQNILCCEALQLLPLHHPAVPSSCKYRVKSVQSVYLLWDLHIRMYIASRGGLRELSKEEKKTDFSDKQRDINSTKQTRPRGEH